MKQLSKNFKHGVLIPVFSILIIHACNSGTRSDSETTEDTSGVVEKSADGKTDSGDTVNSEELVVQQDVKVELPKPDLELPKLPVDKDKLPSVKKLDEMKMDAAIMEATFQQLRDIYDEFNSASYVSLSGTIENRMQTIDKVSAAFKDFQARGIGLANKAMKEIGNKYGSASDFTSLYRDTYFKAEEETSAVVDNVKRREVNSILMNDYKYPPDFRKEDIERKVNEGQELRNKGFNQMLDAVATDMYSLGYLKGTELTTTMAGAKNTLNAMQRLNPNDEQQSKINEMLAKITETEKTRLEEIKNATAAYRLPERSGIDDGSALEDQMRAQLEKAGYKIKALKITSPNWVEINNLFGACVYKQISFHVVAEEANLESGVLAVYLVSGQTGNCSSTKFVTRSVADVSWMLEKNL